MKHYIFIKQTKTNISKVYECWCDTDTARGFLKALEKQYGCYLTLVEVIL